MYARLATVNVVPGSRPTMEAIAEQLAPIYRGQKGFKGITFIFDDEGSTYGSLTLWATREDAEAAQMTGGARGQRATAAIATGPTRVQIFEVYELQG